LKFCGKELLQPCCLSQNFKHAAAILQILDQFDFFLKSFGLSLNLVLDIWNKISVVANRNLDPDC